MKQGPRPQSWKSGPDPIDHEIYVAWARAKAQANFRGEPWDLSYEDYHRIWRDNWHLRGRSGTSLILTRLSSHAAWHRDNVYLCEKTEVLINQGLIRREQNGKKNRSSTLRKMEDN